VPNTIPGDRVKAALVKVHKNHLEARLEEVVEASPLRIAARCKHFGVCGGCTWQNLAYADQLKFKEQIVRETLEHLGGFSKEALEKVMRPVLGCNDPWFYRNKMELSFDEGEPKSVFPARKGNDASSERKRAHVATLHGCETMPTREASGWGLLKVGLHPRNHRYEVFDMEECFLQSDVLSEIAATMRAFAREHKLTVFKGTTEKGLLRSLMVREGKHTGERMLHLITSAEPFPQLDAFCEAFTSEQWRGRIHSLIWTRFVPEKGRRTRQETEVLWGQPVIHEELRLPSGKGETPSLRSGVVLRFEISAESFFQPNTQQAEVLYGQVLELAELSGTEVVYDLYCGTGTIGLFCAHRAKQVVGIEVVKEAVENGRMNAKRNGLSNVEFFVADVGELVRKGTDAPEPHDTHTNRVIPTRHSPEFALASARLRFGLPNVVIADPPRAGLSPLVPAAIVSLQPAKVVYVSCNPTTLARDLRTFEGLGYRLKIVQPVDMFPQTYHIENVALLER
jgi:23S rRNA (uracil1939-C5)-methyltransferase